MIQDMIKVTRPDSTFSRNGRSESDSGRWPSKLTDFQVVMDKNVATLLITPKDEHRSVQINWGDGNGDFIDFRQTAVQSGFDVPEGSFRIMHVYQKNPLTGLISDSAYVVLTVFDVYGGKSFEGALVKIVSRY